MATINDKAIIENIIKHNGYYEGDTSEPRCLRITEYTNAWGKQTYGCCFSQNELGKYDEQTPFVLAPKIIWDAATKDANSGKE